MRFTPFTMERYQSTFEHRVRINLSESGVHPLTVDELLEIAGTDAGVGGIRLGYGQSNGSDELRHKVAAQYEGATENNVLVTVGGAEANFTCFWHLFETEEKAAVILPTYGQVPGLIDSFEGRIMPVHLVEENDWQPDLEALEAALEAGARFVLITNPNNPTGAALSDASMDAIAEMTARHGAWIMADEVYAGAETGVEKTRSFWGCPRQGAGDELALEGVRASRPKARMDPWAERAHREIVGAHRLHDDRGCIRVRRSGVRGARAGDARPDHGADPRNRAGKPSIGRGLDGSPGRALQLSTAGCRGDLLYRV